MSVHYQVKESLRGLSFRKQNLPIEAVHSLLYSGHVDSLGMVDLMAELKKQFSIKVERDELVLENFGSIDSIAIYLEKRKC